MRSVFRLLLALIVTFAAAAAPAQARVPADFFGVMADGPLLAPQADLAGEARIMRGAGIGTARIAFYWRDMQPIAGAPVDFTETDRIVRALAASRVGVMPVLVRAPAWAANGDTREGAVPDSAAYAAFAREIVRRYGVRGTFWAQNPGVPAERIRSFQVWNEPDIKRYWLGTPWPSTYVGLLRAAHAAIKAEDRGAEVVAAGLTNQSWIDLRKLYAAGARRYFDAAAIHPFSARVENVVKIARLSRAEMRKRGDARKPLMLTEVSWSSGKGKSSFNYGWETTESGQATKVRQALRALARARTELRIGGVWWYTWLSPQIGDDESFSYSGLRRLSGSRAVNKPALRAFRETARALRR